MKREVKCSPFHLFRVTNNEEVRIVAEYDRLDADIYDYYSIGPDGNVEFYVAEAIKAGSPVLEVACGTGRITFPVVQAGIQITDLDLSPSMLEVAAHKLETLDAETQSRVELVKGDMRDFSLGKKFQLIIIPYNAFQYIYTTEDQKRALTCIREHLDESGQLIFSIFDPKLNILTEHASSLGPAVKLVREFVHPVTGRRVMVWDTRKYDLFT